MREVVIVSAARTPVGSFQGSLSKVPSTELGALAVKEAVSRAGIAGSDIDEVIMGCVLPAGLGQAPARQAALGAGLPATVECMTINKVCGSGLKSVMLAAQAIAVGDADAIVAGGMENMTRAPYLVSKGRGGYRMGNGVIEDVMIKDGLWDPYNNFHMGSAADMCGKEHDISREAQDDFAVGSYQKAQAAQAAGKFVDEIFPVEIPARKGKTILFEEDEEPKRFNEEKLRSLRPAFNKDGSVTAGNASSINDGAAAFVVMAADKAEALGLTPMARVGAQCSAARPPEWFTIAPADAMRKIFEKTGYSASDIDLYEINEAFSVVSLYAIRELGIDKDRVNVNGGAVAIGHPIGASGARILSTLLYAMKDRDAKRGLACLCIGGGEAAALIVER